MYMPITVTKIKNTDNTTYCQGHGVTGTLSYVADRRQNGMATLQNSLVISYKVRDITWFRNLTPTYLT